MRFITRRTLRHLASWIIPRPCAGLPPLSDSLYVHTVHITASNVQNQQFSVARPSSKLANLATSSRSPDPRSQIPDQKLTTYYSLFFFPPSAGERKSHLLPSLPLKIVKTRFLLLATNGDGKWKKKKKKKLPIRRIPIIKYRTP